MDLAEAVDDLICIFDGSGDTTMDTLAMFVFGWALAALFVLWLGKLVYAKFLRRAIENTVAPDPIPLPASDDGSVVAGSSLRKTNSLPRSSSGGGVGGSGGGGGGVVPSTPTTVRKRLTRQSPGPDLMRGSGGVGGGLVGGSVGGSAGSVYLAAPQCTGADNVCVLWVNDVLQWLWLDGQTAAQVMAVWLRSMNVHCQKAAEEQGVGVEFIRILPESHAPNLSNIFAECAPNDDVTITCDCESTPALQIKVYRQTGDKIDTCHYRVNVNRFRGRLSIFCVSEKLLADIKCEGWPEIKVALAPVGVIKNNVNESQLQDVVNEIVTNAIRNTQFNLNLYEFQNCPRLVRHVETPMSRFRFDGNINSAYASTPTASAAAHASLADTSLVGKRLLVKIVKASQLGDRCTEPYCVVEMDEPPQKNQTAIQKTSGDSPVWDEHFLFDLSPYTAEILLEVYDHSDRPSRFLGLGIVGMDELLLNAAQRQIIALQGRPYETDVAVSGTVTVEFMFVDGNELPNVTSGNRPFKIKESLSAPQRGSTPITTQKVMNGDHRHPIESTNGDRNTLVIHSVQRQPSQRVVKVELNDGSWREIERIELPSVDSCDSLSSATQLSNSNGAPKNQNPLPMLNNTIPNASSPNNLTTTMSPTSQVAAPIVNTDPMPVDQRGRTKKRRDFFGTIKKRLGRSKNRTRSAGPEGDEFGRDDSANRSISADRGRGVSDGSRLTVGGVNRETSSRRSSISEASGLSTASTRTYINEASNLVLETVENGVKKHYLVPLSLAQKSRWRKKGTKLHIFNDHTFVAKHLSGGTICQVCNKSLARRIGKQGYECRDCLLKCHKHCHVKTNEICPTSTIHNIELSYIQNPLTDKNLGLI